MAAASVYALTLALAYCSIVYELVLAQTMAGLFGNTLLRYNVTIGLYLAALGTGSLLAGSRARREALDLLARVELALSLLGAAGPVLMHLWDLGVAGACPAVGLSPQGAAYRALALGFDHLLVAAVGVLSGFELPLLMALAKDGRSDRVLAVDYAGTLAGAVSFPLLLLPVFGLVAASASTALLNGLCGCWLLARAGPARRRRRWAGYAGALALCCGLLAFTGPIERALSGSVLVEAR